MSLEDVTREPYDGPPRARILLAEDAPTQAELTRFTLEDAGFEVRHAPDGLTALELAGAWHPDLVLSDVLMPGLGGYELCRRLKADNATRATPVVLLTSLSETEDVIEGLECGADHFITKPFDDASLISRIEEALRADATAPPRDEEPDSPGGGVTINLGGRDHVITAGRHRILRMLLSTFETAVQRNKSLRQATREAQELAATLEEKVRERTASERRAVEELTEANRLKDEFLAVLSHELRTPLTPLLGWTRLLRSGELAATRYPDIFAVLERNLQAQAHIINDLLDVSRIVSGKMALEATDVSLAAVARGAVEALAPAARNKGVDLSFESHPSQRGSADGPHVNADPGRLHQIVWNLVSNGVKFTPQGGTVTVRVWQRGDEGVVEVTDDGIGIEPAFLPHVFDRFRQASMGVTRRYGGLGLGLSIAKALVELHGGTIGVESPGPDAGTTFTLRFPVAHVAARLSTRSRAGATPALGPVASAPGPTLPLQHAPQHDPLHAPSSATPTSPSPSATPDASIPSAASAAPPHSAAPQAFFTSPSPHSLSAPVGSAEGGQERALAHLTILVVDDDEDTRDFISALLSFAGARVTAVSDGIEAREVLSRETFDLIVSDLSMPGEDGFALIEKVRAGGGNNHRTPAIALTAHVRPEDETRALAAGFQEHMIKPPKRERLIARVAELARPGGAGVGGRPLLH